jgi:hypothetical protein
MNELIGMTIKTHGSHIVSKVREVEPVQVGLVARKQFGIEQGQPYVAFAVRTDEKWTTLIARDAMEIHKRYVV